jgi:hypothetical protein
MFQFQLPSIRGVLCDKIAHIATPAVPPICVSESLHKYVEDIRIPICERINEWHTYARFAHPFCETVVPICNLLEIVRTFNVLDHNAPLNIMTISQPPGYINVIAHARNYCVKDRYLNIKPSPDTFALTGDWTSAPLSVAGISYFAAVHRNTMNVIFAEIEPNNGLESREVVDFSKVFSQVVYAICMQSTSGTFILTIADIFRAHTIDILAILSIVYETVHIAKPSSSRADTAERFVVCQDFRPIAGANVYSYLHQCFVDLSQTRKCPGIYTHRIFAAEIPSIFLDKISEINAVLGQQQLENLKTTISLIDNKHRDIKTSVLMRQHAEVYGRWCVEYGPLPPISLP